jgi:hypothetical protein
MRGVGSRQRSDELSAEQLKREARLKEYAQLSLADKAKHLDAVDRMERMRQRSRWKCNGNGHGLRPAKGRSVLAVQTRCHQPRRQSSSLSPEDRKNAWERLDRTTPELRAASRHVRTWNRALNAD